MPRSSEAEGRNGLAGTASRTLRAALFLVLLTALALRLAAVGYGNSALTFQIDEDRNVSLPLHLTVGNLRPHDPGYSKAYDYPALFWYILFAFDQAVSALLKAFRVVPDWEGFQRLFTAAPLPFFLLGRTVSVAFGTATVGVLYLLGRRFLSPLHGIVAAALLAGTFLHVRDSALATLDAPVTFFIVLSLLGAGGVLQRGRRRDYALAGIAAGLATATKYNGGLVLVALLAAHALHDRPGGKRVRPSPRLVAGLLLAVVAFLVVNPYLVLDWRKAVADLAWLGARIESGQFESVGPAWRYHVTVSLRYGMGLTLLALSVAGIARTLWRPDAAGATLFLFAAAFYAVMGTARLVFVRYMTPLLPVLCLFAATAILALTEPITPRRLRVGAVAALGVLALVEPLAAVAQYVRIVHHVDTRVQAYEFLLTLPPNSDVATYGPDMVWRSTLPPFPRWKPTYYAKHPNQTWDDVFVALKTKDIRYLLVHTSDLSVFSPTNPDLERALQRSATLVREFAPTRPGAHPVYDRVDPFYVPIGGFRGVARPGPHIRLYQLK